VAKYELDAAKCRYLSKRQGTEITPTDCMKVKLGDMPQAQVIYTGGSCKPWAHAGTRKGWKHPEACHILKTIDM
jgi:hypothetical protein